MQIQPQEIFSRIFIFLLQGFNDEIDMIMKNFKIVFKHGWEMRALFQCQLHDVFMPCVVNLKLVLSSITFDFVMCR